MNQENFTTTFTVNQPPEKVFNAINNVYGWWGGEVKGDTKKIGSEFTYRWKDQHYTKQKIIEFIPQKKIVWDISDCNIPSLKNTGEWNGTKISFEIFKKGDKTDLKFTHFGLIPEFECYESCARDWTKIMNVSLKKLIESRNQKETKTK